MGMWVVRVVSSVSVVAALAWACTSLNGKSDVYRIKGDGGVTVQCRVATDSACGLTLVECGNKHEYHCLHGMDLELSSPDASIPPTPAATTQPQAPAPAPTPQK